MGIAPARVVGHHHQQQVVLKLIFQFGKIPAAHADVDPRVVQGVDGIPVHPHLFRDPFPGLGHDLHHTDGSHRGYGPRFELAFIFNDRRHQEGIYVVAPGVCDDLILVRPHIYKPHLHRVAAPEPPARQRQYRKKQQYVQPHTSAALLFP